MFEYSISESMKAHLATDCFNNAARSGDVTGWVFPFGRATLSQSMKLIQASKRQGLVKPMSRVGAAGNECAMGLFPSLLQKDRGKGSLATRAKLKSAVVPWHDMDRFDLSQQRSRTTDVVSRKPLTGSRSRGAL